jgi:hypothetical protein
MPKQLHMALITTLVCLQGCAGVITVKLPIAKTPNVVAEVKTPAPLTVAKPTLPPTLAATSLSLTGIALPHDISVKLPASLLDSASAKVISNDGGTVISNDGSTVISNDGSTVISNDGSTVISGGGGSAMGTTPMFRLAAASDDPALIVPGIFHLVTSAYSGSIAVINLLLTLANSKDNLDELHAGRQVEIPIPSFDETAKTLFTKFTMQLKAPAGRDPVLEFLFKLPGDAQLTKVMEISFKDPDHGRVIYHGSPGMPAVEHGYSYTGTFDRIKNKAEIDYAFTNFRGYGTMRLHFNVSRPEPLVVGGPTSIIRLATAARKDIYSHKPSELKPNEYPLPAGQVEATAYAFNGSSSAIFGVHPLGATDPTVNFFKNAQAPVDQPLAFFIGPKGSSLVTPTPQMLANIPPLTDIYKPFMEDPDSRDMGKDPIFQFQY